MVCSRHLFSPILIAIGITIGSFVFLFSSTGSSPPTSFRPEYSTQSTTNENIPVGPENMNDLGLTVTLTLHKTDLNLNEGNSLIATVKVTNINSHPVTVLTWGSPLEKLAQALGVFKLVDEVTNEEVEVPSIMLRRVMPPSRDADLVEIPSKKSVEFEHNLREILGALKRDEGATSGKTYTIHGEGSWMQVWRLEKSEITEGMLAELGGSDSEGEGSFKSNKVKVTVKK